MDSLVLCGIWATTNIKHSLATEETLLMLDNDDCMQGESPIITWLGGNTSPLDLGRNITTSKKVHVDHEQ
jgi:hypothetical protein